MVLDEVTLLLYKLGCIQIGNFKLTSGLWSPIYVDLRKLPSYPNEFKRIVNICVNKIKNLKSDIICGIATGGIPLATLIAYKLRKPLIYVRKAEKGHGTRKLIEGEYDEGDEVIVVDDVSTTGGSLLRAIKVLKNENLKVNHALVIVERGQGACERLAKEGVTLHYIAKLIDMITILFEKQLISQQDYTRIRSYLEGNRNA